MPGASPFVESFGPLGGVSALVGMLGAVVAMLSAVVGMNGDVLNGGLVDQSWVRLIMASALPVVASAVWYRCRTTIEITEREQVLWVELWLSKHHGALTRLPHLRLLSPWETEEADGEGRSSPPRFEYRPSHGHRVWSNFGCWPISIASVGTRSGGGAEDAYPDLLGGKMAGTSGYSLAVTIWFAPCGSSILDMILCEGQKLWLSRHSEKTEIWTYDSAIYNFKVKTVQKRPLSSVIVDGNVKQEILDDAIKFLNKADWYAKRAIPHRRGFLLQ